MDSDDHGDDMLAQLEQQDLALTSTAKKSEEDNMIKAQEVKKQIERYNDILELRILLQQVISIANRLPDSETLQSIKTNNQKVEHLCDNICSNSQDLLQELCNGRVVKEQTEEGTSAWECPPINVVGPQKRSTEEVWDELQNQTKRCKLWWKDEIAYWNQKVSLLQLSQSKLSSARRTPFEQSELLVNDPDYFKKKIPLSDAPQRVKVRLNSDVKGQNDEKVFDDSEFYHRLLKEFLENSGETNSALTKSKKTKKTSHTKTSKGRKIKYEVHPKLQNFMFPINVGNFNDETPHLVRSLFMS